MPEVETPVGNEPILDPSYWKARLDKAQQLHHAIFRCPLEKWAAIERAHRRILAEKIGQFDSVLDAGCGWGRLLDLMPTGWMGDYLGVDVSPDFIDLAKEKHPSNSFLVGDIGAGLSYFGHQQFNWAVLVSIRPMVKRNLGDRTWEVMELNLRRVAKQLLFLEYDETDQGASQ